MLNCKYNKIAIELIENASKFFEKIPLSKIVKHSTVQFSRLFMQVITKKSSTHSIANITNLDFPTRTVRVRTFLKPIPRTQSAFWAVRVEY